MVISILPPHGQPCSGNTWVSLGTHSNTTRYELLFTYCPPFMNAPSKSPQKNALLRKNTNWYANEYK